jgi:polyferredoxin
MSLIQQRIAIDRQRTMGIVFTAFGAAMVVLQVLSLLTRGFSLITLPTLLLWSAACGIGVYRLIRAKRSRLAFEAEHGPDAGKQEPID